MSKTFFLLLPMKSVIPPLNYLGLLQINQNVKCFSHSYFGGIAISKNFKLIIQSLDKTLC